jgi:thiamine-monophosphate kinase
VRENELIEKIAKSFGAVRKGALVLGMGDDAALYSPRIGCEVVLTCDWFLEGSHFLREKHPADAVGWKCLARAVSDIAAMGGAPRCFLLSLALPESATGVWLSGFLRGLRRASKMLQFELAGGDTTRREEILINVTVVGEVRRRRALRRDGARPGDLLFVTGTLGEAELGLQMLRKASGPVQVKNQALRKHLYPVPRLAVGQWLAERQLASAMMDLSDGLSTDLERMCIASGVGARIEAERLPVSSLVARKEGVKLALHGGDDYELLFAVRPEMARKIPSAYRGVEITRVGEIVTGKKTWVEERGKKQALVSGGWDPFGKK